MHMTDMDPTRAGQEFWQCHETPGAYGEFGIEFRDARTGVPIWGRGASAGITGDIGRAMAGDVDPAYPGYEVWASSGDLYTCKGVSISTTKPSNNFGIWWDGDLCRELLDGVKLDKWNPATKSSDRLLTLSSYGNATSNNTTKANPCLTADLYGDWREEAILRAADNASLLIFTTTIPTSYRLYTLMHNPQYRLAVAWQNTAYNQPPYPDYYLGTGMTTPPQPNIYLTGNHALSSDFKWQHVENGLTISPNPASHIVRLDLKKPATNLHLKVTGSDGKVVLNVKGGLSQLNNSLNNKLSSLRPGVYLVQVSDGKEVYNSKLLKE
jgi:rhamnogalacturonan endolyase